MGNEMEGWVGKKIFRIELKKVPMDIETKPLTSTGQGQIKSSDWSLRGALIFVCIVAAVFIGLFGWQTSRVNQTSSDASGSVVVDCSSCPCEPDCSTCPSDCNSCPAYTDPSQYCLDQGLGYDGSAWCETNMPAYIDPNGYCDSSGSELTCANAASKCPDIMLVSASACSDAGYYSCEAALVDCSSCASTNCDPTVVCASGYIPDDQCNTCCASGSTVSSCTDISGCIVASDCNTCCDPCAATADSPGYSMCAEGTPTHKYGICVCNPIYNPYCTNHDCPSHVGDGTACAEAGDNCTYISNGNYPENYCTQITPKTAGQMSQGKCNEYFTCEENTCMGTPGGYACACRADTNPNCSYYPNCPTTNYDNCNNLGDDSDKCIKIGPAGGTATTSQCNQADPTSCTTVPGCFNAGGFPYASNDTSWPTGFPQ